MQSNFVGRSGQWKPMRILRERSIDRIPELRDVESFGASERIISAHPKKTLGRRYCIEAAKPIAR